METVTRTIGGLGGKLGRVAIELPANVKALLRNGTLTVYDLLELAINTISVLVSKNDKNVDALEEWTANLAEWSEELKNAVTEMLYNALLDADFTIKNGTIGFDKLSESVKEFLIKDISLENENGTWYLVFTTLGDDGFVELLEKKVSLDELVEYLKTKKGNAIEKLEVDDKGTIKIYIIDEENPIKATIPYAKDVIGTSMDFVLGGLMTTGQSKKVDGLGAGRGLTMSSDYKLNINVDDNGVLTIGDKRYQLEEIEDNLTYEYSYPIITAFSYPSMPSEGGTIKPDVLSFTQTKNTYRNGEKVDSETIYGSLSDMKGATVGYVAQFAGTGVKVGIDGKVTCEGSLLSYDNDIAEVVPRLTMNDKQAMNGNEKKVTITQSGATATLESNTLSVKSSASSTTISLSKKTNSKINITSVEISGSGANYSLSSDKRSVVVIVLANTTTSKKTYGVTLTTNIKNSDGSYVKLNATITQAEGGETPVPSYNIYYGKSLALPVDVTIGDKLSTSDSSFEVSVESAFADKVKCHWIAISNTSGYTVEKATDQDGDEVTLTTYTSIDGYKLYCRESAGAYYNSKTIFKIKK